MLHAPIVLQLKASPFAPIIAHRYIVISVCVIKYHEYNIYKMSTRNSSKNHQKSKKNNESSKSFFPPSGLCLFNMPDHVSSRQFNYGKRNAENLAKRGGKQWTFVRSTAGLRQRQTETVDGRFSTSSLLSLSLFPSPNRGRH